MPKQKNQEPRFVHKWALSKPELAAALGESVRTINHWQYNKRIPFFKVGGMVRFDLQAVQKALDRYVVEAKAP